MRRHLVSQSAEHTLELGRWIGARARPGLVVALVGQLGAGKTLFTRGIHRGLGLTDETWSGSPTFVLATRYAGTPPLLHADLYRLSSAGEVVDLGIEDALADGAVVVVEWADRVPDALPTARLTVSFAVLDTDRREIVLDASGDVAESLLGELPPHGVASIKSSPATVDAAVGSRVVTSEGARWP